MGIKGAKTIAEYAIRRWLINQGFAIECLIECFDLHMDGNEGVLEDAQKNTMTLVYDAASKEVYVKE